MLKNKPLVFGLLAALLLGTAVSYGSQIVAVKTTYQDITVPSCQTILHTTARPCKLRSVAIKDKGLPLTFTHSVLKDQPYGNVAGGVIVPSNHLKIGAFLANSVFWTIVSGGLIFGVYQKITGRKELI